MSRAGPASTSDFRTIALNGADDIGVNVVAIQAVQTTDTVAYRALTMREPDPADVTGKSYWLVQIRAEGAFSCECSYQGKGPPQYFDYVVEVADRTQANGPFLLTDPVRLVPFGKVVDISV